jgi:cytochrome c oxidase subunit 2
MNDKFGNGDAGAQSSTTRVVEGIGLALLFALVGTVGFSYGARSWFPELASRHGAGIDLMLNFLLVAVGLLFLLGHLFLALFIWQGVRRDRVSHRLLAPAKERWISCGLGVLFAVVAEGGVLAIGMPVWIEYFTPSPPNDAVVIEVTGQQFMWHARYPGADGRFGPVRPSLIDSQTNPIGLVSTDESAADDVVLTGEIYAPVNRSILIRLRATDVIHSFFVPSLRVKQDIVPGMTPEILFVATKEGRFDIACTELCGLGHYRMQGFFNVVSEPEFERWLSEQEP